ncbi:MAG TPA: hypothetical protein VMS18_13575, partial [Candidatus Binatia bacterium]|nr:hypothetical protein [Candidatus Binatia bacterium]
LRRFRFRKPSAFSPVVSSLCQGMFVAILGSRQLNTLHAHGCLRLFSGLPKLGQCPQAVADNATSCWWHDAK